MKDTDKLENSKFNYDYEKNLNFKQRKKLNLITQLLDASSDIEKIDNQYVDLFFVLKEATAKKTNSQFKKSIINSMVCLMNSKHNYSEVSKLVDNEPNSFIVLPLNTFNYTFSSVIRKVDEDYSLTIVSKANDSIHREGSEESAQFQEYIIDKNALGSFLEFIKNKSIYQNEQSIYKLLDANSKSKKILNVKSKPHKINNVSLKNQLEAFNYALITRNFDKKNFERLANNEEKTLYLPNLLKKLNLKEYLLSSSFTKDSLALKNAINREFSAYEFNNMLMNKLQKQQPIDFKIEKRLKYLNMNTISCEKTALEKAIQKIDNKNLTSSFNTVKSFSDIKNRKENIKHINSDNEIENLLKSLVKAENFFPKAVSEIRKELHLEFFYKASYVARIKTQPSDRKIPEIIKYLTASNKLYGYSSTNRVFSGISYAKMANFKDKDTNLKKAVDEFSKAINLSPELYEAFALRAVQNNKLGNIKKYHKDAIVTKQNVKKLGNLEMKKLFINWYLGCGEQINADINKVLKVDIKIPKEGLQLTRLFN